MTLSIPKIDFSKLDTAALTGDISAIIQDCIAPFIQATEEDLQKYARSIASDAVQAMKESDPVHREALLKELLQQAVMVMEISKIRAEQALQATFEAVLQTALKTAFKLLVPI